MLAVALFPRKLAFKFRVFGYGFTFYVISGFKKSDSGTGMHYGSGSVMAKVVVPVVPASGPQGH
jgi:hypothetical protein